MRSGSALTGRLFTRKYEHERNMAVMSMVEMSVSTEGCINEVEREALVLPREALESLGDRHAIYGVCGNTRKKCELFLINRFDEGDSDVARGRIEAKQQGIAPFCIIIDETARDYLAHLYGAVNYTVIAKLPLKVSDMYRRLTS